MCVAYCPSVGAPGRRDDSRHSPPSCRPAAGLLHPSISLSERDKHESRGSRCEAPNKIPVFLPSEASQPPNRWPHESLVQQSTAARKCVSPAYKIKGAGSLCSKHVCVSPTNTQKQSLQTAAANFHHVFDEFLEQRSHGSALLQSE